MAVTLTYTTGRGHALIGRALYLPEACAADEEHRELAGVPEDVMFATKPQLVGGLLDRAQSLGIRAAFVTGDEVYGGRRAATGYPPARDRGSWQIRKDQPSGSGPTPDHRVGSPTPGHPPQHRPAMTIMPPSHPHMSLPPAVGRLQQLAPEAQPQPPTPLAPATAPPTRTRTAGRRQGKPENQPTAGRAITPAGSPTAKTPDHPPLMRNTRHPGAIIAWPVAQQGDNPAEQRTGDQQHRERGHPQNPGDHGQDQRRQQPQHPAGAVRRRNKQGCDPGDLRAAGQCDGADRWLTAEHPGITGPGQWTRQTRNRAPVRPLPWHRPAVDLRH